MMDYKEEYEQEIDLKDLLFYLLYKWRPILLILLLLGIVGWAIAGGGNKGLTYALVGFAGGLLFMGFLYAIAYVASDKIRDERELKERYGYRLLGTIPRQKKKKFLPFIDSWLERLEKGIHQITEEEAYRIVAVNITNHANEGGTFLVTGTVNADKVFEMIPQMTSQLQENVTLIGSPDMNVSADTLEMLAWCDGVILVEQRNESLRAEIQKEHESIMELHKTVIGYIVI